MSTVTLSVRTLSKLVDPVLPHTSHEGIGLILESVLIRQQGDWLTALGTNRYTLAMQRVAVPKPEPVDGVVEIAAPPEGESFAAAIPRTVIARIRLIFKATRNSDPVITLAVDEADRLTVTSADTLDGLVGAALTFQLPSPVKTYPDLARLIEPALKSALAADALPCGGTFSPQRLASFAIGHPHYDHAVITPTDPSGNKPWLVRIGEDFIGLIVPVRTGDAQPDRSSWLPLVEKPAAAVAA